VQLYTACLKARPVSLALTMIGCVLPACLADTGIVNAAHRRCLVLTCDRVRHIVSTESDVYE